MIEMKFLIPKTFFKISLKSFESKHPLLSIHSLKNSTRGSHVCTTDTCSMTLLINYQTAAPQVTGLFPSSAAVAGALKPQAVVTNALAAGVQGAAPSLQAIPGISVTFADMVAVRYSYLLLIFVDFRRKRDGDESGK